MACLGTQSPNNLQCRNLRLCTTERGLWKTLTSMTWLDELVFTWVHIATPFAAHAKFASLAQIGPRRGVLSPTSLASRTQRSRIYCGYPVPAAVIAPYTTHKGMACKLSEWRDRLPATFPWPRVASRIEDGGGLPSTALHTASLGL